MTELSFVAEVVRDSVLRMEEAIQAATAPHVRMRPTVAPDGNKWCCLYGDDLMVGVAGFGDTPQQACWDFDRAWNSDRTWSAIAMARDSAETLAAPVPKDCQARAGTASPDV